MPSRTFTTTDSNWQCLELMPFGQWRPSLWCLTIKGRTERVQSTKRNDHPCFIIIFLQKANSKLLWSPPTLNIPHNPNPSHPFRLSREDTNARRPPDSRPSVCPQKLTLSLQLWSLKHFYRRKLCSTQCLKALHNGKRLISKQCLDSALWLH